MSPAGLGHLLAAHRKDHYPTDGQELLAGFLRDLEEVEKWKQKLLDTLEGGGRIGSSAGNFRYRSCRGALCPAERRWAVSQVVQGTGAFIFKRVVLAVSSQAAECEMLIPLHDAILFQVPQDQRQALCDLLHDLFKRVFCEVCPSIVPEVKIAADFSK
jgi:hypothetical protein